MQSPLNFSLHTYTPQGVILRQDDSKELFRLHPHPPCSLRLQIQHPHLLRPTSIEQGLLYPLQQSNLDDQLCHTPFEEEQIINTFLPLFDCVGYLASKGITHGSISASTIVIHDNRIMLVDWLPPRPTTAFSDHIALGRLMAQCALGTTLDTNDVHGIVQALIAKYTKAFVCTVIGIVKNNISLQQIVGMLNKEHKSINHISEAYDRIKREKDQQSSNIINTINNNPSKRVSISKKCSNNNENAREIRKDKVERMENSNAFVHQLISRKMNNQCSPGLNQKKGIRAHLYTQSKGFTFQKKVSAFNPPSVWKIRGPMKKK